MTTDSCVLFTPVGWSLQIGPETYVTVLGAPECPPSWFGKGWKGSAPFQLFRKTLENKETS